MHLLFEIFKTCSESYDEFYEQNRIAYVNFVNFAPSIQTSMQKVDEHLQGFEATRS